MPDKLSKATLREKLTQKGYVLRPEHWRELDRLFKKGGGYVFLLTVTEAAKRWGWSEPMIAELRKALK